MLSYRVFLFAALAASVFAVGYIPGKEYHYKYKGSIFHELDKKVHQHSGFLAKSDVFLQPHAGYCTVKIKNVKFHQINGRPNKDQEPNFQGVPAIEEFLKKPFQIHYDHDVISQLKVEKDDPIWSVNMKKALASLLQLNFDRTNLLHDNVAEKYHSKLEFDNHNYYKVMEDGLRGECETLYEVSSLPEYRYHNNVLNVTKTKNYDNCKTRPYKFFRNQNYELCTDCAGDIKKPFHVSDFYHYSIRGDRHNFLIEKLHTEERFTYAPFGIEGEFIKGDSNRSLVLLEEKDVQEEFQLSDDLVTHHDLQFDFENKEEIKDVDDLKKPIHIYDFLQIKSQPEVAVELFNKILESYNDKPYTDSLKEKNLPLQFFELTRTFSYFSYDEFLTFFNTHVNAKDKGWSKEIEVSKKWLFLDAVTYVGTSASFIFIKHLITDVHIPHHVVINYLEQVPHTLKVYNKVLLEEFYTLCKHPYVNDNPSTRKVCYLSFSSFIHTHCVGEYFNVHNRFHPTEMAQCTPKTAAKYFEQLVVHPTEHHEDSHERITRIKTAGNFGVRENIKYLKPLIYGEEIVPNYFRVSAIWALRRVATFYPDEVLSLLIPVYFNTTEPHEIRIAAFTMIMITGPPLYNVEMIAESLPLEPSHQLAHYVASTFKYLSTVENPCYLKLAETSKKVLRYLDRLYFAVHHDMRHSFIWIKSGFNKKMHIGGSTFFSYITSNQSYVPHDMYLAFGDYIGAKNMYPLELGYVGYGLDKFFDRLFGPQGVFKQHKSIFDIFKRKTRDASNVEKELKQIDERLHIHPREQEPIYGDVFIRAYGNEINFFHFNESLFESFFNDGVLSVPDFQNGLKDVGKFTVKRFYTGPEITMVAPSAIGLPSYLNVKEIIHFYYRNNNFKFNVDPSLFAEDRNNELPKQISFKVDGHVLVDRLKSVASGVILPFLHTVSSAGVLKRDYCSLPLKFELSYDPKVSKIELKYTPVIPHTRVYKSFTPFTLIGDIKTVKVDSLLHKNFLPYYKDEELKKVEKDFFHDYLGYGVNFKGKFGHLHHLKSWSDFWKYLGELSFRDKFYEYMLNPHGVAYEYELSVTPANRDQTNEIDLVLTLDHSDFLENKAYKPNWPVVQDGFEEYGKTRGDRKIATCLIKGEIVAKGTKERKVVAELGYSYSFDKLFHKWHLFYDRAPFSPAETDHFKVCYSSSLKYPFVSMKKLYDLDTLDLDPKANVAVEARFGKDCDTDQKITVRGVLSRSKRQKTLEAEREKPEHNSLAETPYGYLYKLCKKNNDRGVHYSVPCRKYWHRSTKLHHYEFDIDYSKLSPDFKNATSKFDTFLKAVLYYYLDENKFLVNNEDNKLHIEADFSPKDQEVDILIKKQHEVSHFTHVPIPDWVHPRSAMSIFDFTNLKMIWMYFKVPYCAVEGDHVHTFDFVEYQLPTIDCYKVLAKDCSHKELFTVLGKKVKHNRYSKAVKVFLDHWKVEILPISEDSEILVRLDGKRVPVTASEPYFHKETVKGKEKLLFYVAFNGHYYTLKSEHYGVSVFYDGKAIFVHLSPYYRGKQCGICGDFNNEDKGEFRGPENCVYKNVTDFSYSYVIPENGCKVPETKSPCDLQHVSPCTVLRNRYVYVGTRDRQVCFTTDPLPECSPECTESSKKVSRQVGFHCLPARDDFTRFLLRESRQRILHEVEKKSEDHFEKLEFPETCHHPSF